MSNAPPLMGGDQPARLQAGKGEGDQTFFHPHLTSPFKGEGLGGNPIVSYRELSS